jgi:hypothetical protein
MQRFTKKDKLMKSLEIFRHESKDTRWSRPVGKYHARFPLRTFAVQSFSIPAMQA